MNNTVKAIIRWQRIGCICVDLADRLGISYSEAMDIFYHSRTSERFHDESSGLYLFGNLYIVDELLREKQQAH